MAEPEKEKLLLLIPAYNEAGTILHAVAQAQKLVQEGTIDDFVVVDDHSKDSTGAIAAKAGATVVKQKTIMRPCKSAAFATGVLHFKKLGYSFSDTKSDILLTLDADLVGEFSRRHIDNMLMEIHGNPNCDMAVCPAREEIRDTLSLSGVRAIRLSSLRFLLASKELKSGKTAHAISEGNTAQRMISSGYGLETFLNEFFHRRMTFLHQEDYETVKFKVLLRGSRRDWQNRELTETREKLEERHKKWRLLASRLHPGTRVKSHDGKCMPDGMRECDLRCCVKKVLPTDTETIRSKPIKQLFRAY